MTNLESAGVEVEVRGKVSLNTCQEIENKYQLIMINLIKMSKKDQILGMTIEG